MLCTAKHENGTTWQFAVAVAKGRDEAHMRRTAATCVMNYCRKKGCPGVVTVSGDMEIVVIVTEIYTVAEYDLAKRG